MTAAAAAVAAFGLPWDLDIGTVDLDIGDLLHECERERLLGLLARAIREGRFEATDEGRERVETVFRGWLSNSITPP